MVDSNYSRLVKGLGQQTKFNYQNLLFSLTTYQDTTYVPLDQGFANLNKIITTNINVLIHVHFSFDELLKNISKIIIDNFMPFPRVNRHKFENKNIFLLNCRRQILTSQS